MKRILPILLLFSILAGCSTDFDINAEWKETTIVYCLLNQNDSVHYVKITKAFLGDGNALTMAANSDSSSYGNNLEVSMEEWINNYQTQTWFLDTTTITDKDPGIFYYPEQMIYKFDGYLDTMNQNAVYKLKIYNKKNGKQIYSETPLVQNISMIKPTTMAIFHSKNPYIVEWYSGKNGKLFQLVIRFNYWEKNVDIPNDSTLKYIDWSLGSVASNEILGNEEMTITYYGDAFFQFLKNHIANDPDMIRHIATPPFVPNTIEFIFTIASDELYTYMQVNQPTSGIVLEKPEYTNISNGIGIFAARTVLDVPLEMHLYSRDSLFNGRYTKDLNFK